MTQKPARKKLFTKAGDWLALTIIVALTLFLILVNLLKAAGLWLVEGSLYIFVPLVLALFALGWGCTAIVRRIRRPVLKRVIGAVLVLVMLGLTFLGLQYGAFASGLTAPTLYATMTAPESGRHLLVMRTLDADETRIYARRDARLAADPEAEPEVVLADWGYIYTAYAPGPMNLFYRPDTLIEGKVYMGYASTGELMMEWNDDETEARFFVKNPEPNDSGELRARAG